MTHSSIIKYLLDLLAVALKDRGSIVIGDAPLQSCDFDELVRRTRHHGDCRRRARKAPGSRDFHRGLAADAVGRCQHRADTARDRRRCVAKNFRLIDLGAASFLEDLSDYADRFRVTCYAPQLMAAHHHRGKHEVLRHHRVFDADLLINLPKMKTHIKAGLTGALKNMVGINGHKEFLPHHLRGSSESGGDCYYRGHRMREWYDAASDRFWDTSGNLVRTTAKTSARSCLPRCGAPHGC